MSSLLLWNRPTSSPCSPNCQMPPAGLRTETARRSPLVLHRPHIRTAQRCPIPDVWPDQQAVPDHEEVIAMTATQQRHQRSWRLMAALHRTARTLRYVNDELMRANEAIFRPVGAPPP